MKSFVKNHLYTIFVIILILAAGGVYWVNHNEPVMAITSEQRHPVRHEKNDNKLTAIEQYFEKRLSSRFTEKKIKEVSMIVIVAALILLICEPLILWFIYSGRKRQKPLPADDHHGHLIHHYQNPYRIDQDTDKDFKIF